jgi:hypothetical protein
MPKNYGEDKAYNQAIGYAQEKELQILLPRNDTLQAPVWADIYL